ncbi:hypothetical protein Phum_PHUM487600 [Pediculus humanus corporis]|uniref:Uncharacterized protein n=1 Tax=Pediculus humanus subsp. corporis TaxID=121224 RepID=E0VWJ5_PEDHC|nr:uncharacterized protein Phum_PHUM487600 [Pediculus humanus corporis]EEB17751.1 hypothetical protein Phum_PHUM487600 [Pediculus humanus corporis]
MGPFNIVSVNGVTEMADQKTFLDSYDRHGGGRGGAGRGDDHMRGNRWGGDRRMGPMDDYPTKRRRY